MSPDVEWDVDTDSSRQVLVKTPPPRSSPPRNKIIVLIIIIFGITLSAIYRSIPEPPKIPTITPAIGALQLTPLPIETVIASEAQALAFGNRDQFMSIQDPLDSAWYKSQGDSFKAWWQPYMFNPSYSIIATGTLADDRVWADVRQLYTNWVYVRETRFYRLENNTWYRTRPDVSFWSGQNAQLSTPHFNVVYPKEDLSLAQIIVDRFEHAYGAVCGDLHCETDPASRRLPASRILPRVLTLTLVLTQAETFNTIDQGQYVTMTLPSPRMMRIADSWGAPDDPIDAMAIDQLVMPIARIVSGGADRWFKSSDGVLFFNAITNWERLRAGSVTEFFLIDYRNNQLIRLAAHTVNDLTQQQFIEQLQAANIIPLKALWSWPLYTPPDNNMLKLMETEAASAIAYIQFTYKRDGVPRLLFALAAAQSLPEAIQQSFGTKYEDFEKAWLKWLGR